MYFFYSSLGKKDPYGQTLSPDYENFDTFNYLMCQNFY